jgi:hypothetical protein
MIARISSVLAGLALAVAVSGCGGSGRMEVTGRLTYKGQPVPSTQVTFQPDDGSRRSTAVTDDSGNFRLRYSRDESGAMPGRHTVTLKYDVSLDEELHKVPPKATKELLTVIAKYKDPKSSPLHYEVNSSGQFIEIKLPD